MKSKDMLNAANTEILQRLHTAVKEDNEDAFVQAWTDYANNIQKSVLHEARGLVQGQDVAILNSRGVRQLTSCLLYTSHSEKCRTDTLNDAAY